MPIYCISPEMLKGCFSSTKPIELRELYHSFFGHPGKSFSDNIYPVLSDDERSLLYRKYIKNVKIHMLRGIPSYREINGYQWLVDSIKSKGVKVPIVVGIDRWKSCWIIEGHRRSGASLMLKMKCIPAFVVFVGGEDDLPVTSYANQQDAYNKLVG